MAILNILEAPHPVLSKVAPPVDTIDDTLRTLMDNMLETMYNEPGIGLAAPQVNISKRLLVLDVSPEDEAPNPMKFINPEIIWISPEVGFYQEGCLSIPEFYADIERPLKARVAYLDEQGAPQEIEADGLLAVCLQHEIDHLNGILFYDHLSRLKRGRIIKKLLKVQKEAQIA